MVKKSILKCEQVHIYVLSTDLDENNKKILSDKYYKYLFLKSISFGDMKQKYFTKLRRW